MSAENDFKNWLEELRGSVLCDCDHGCRGWIAKNGAKTLKIIEALQKGATVEELDTIAQMDEIKAHAQVWVDRNKWDEEKK